MATPTDLQNASNAIQWTNGQGRITGAMLAGVVSIVIAILAGMGTWSAAGFTPNIAAGSISGTQLQAGAAGANLGGATGDVSGSFPGPLTVTQINGTAFPSGGIIKSVLGAPTAAIAGADYLQPSGSADQLTTVLNGTGALPLKQIFDALYAASFGVVCDGATVNQAVPATPTSPATPLSALAAAARYHVAVIFPGTKPCLISGTVTWSGVQLTLLGEGHATTEIIETTANTSAFVFPNGGYSNEVDAMSIESQTSNTSGIGLSIVGQSNFNSRDLNVSDFFDNVSMLGCGECRFSQFRSFFGAHASALVPGSAGVVVGPNGTNVSTNVQITNFFIGSQINSPSEDSGVLATGVDGLYLRSGYFGRDNNDIRVVPANNVPVQTLSATDIYFDGSFTGNTALSIPAFTGTSQTVQQIDLTADTFDNHLGPSISIQEPTASIKLAADHFLFEHDRCVYVTAASFVFIDSTTFQGCSTATSNGGVSISATKVSVRDSDFTSISGLCLSVTTNSGSPPVLRGNGYDASCPAGSTPPDILPALEFSPVSTPSAPASGSGGRFFVSRTGTSCQLSVVTNGGTGGTVSPIGSSYPCQ